MFSPHPSVEIDVYVDRPESVTAGPLSLRGELRDGDTASLTVPPRSRCRPSSGTMPLTPIRRAVRSPTTLPPTLLQAASRFPPPAASCGTSRTPGSIQFMSSFLKNDKPIDEDSRRLGFREATFIDQGFLLNGKIVKLHGLDRDQTFPWVGQAMSDRGQKQDAKILRHDCRCNIVRTSDYPQSSHFLDARDEIGVLALEETPGWQYIGDVAWQDVTVDNARHRKSLRANRLPGSAKSFQYG